MANIDSKFRARKGLITQNIDFSSLTTTAKITADFLNSGTGTLTFSGSTGQLLSIVDTGTDKLQINGNVVSNLFKGPLQGNADTSSKWLTPRSLTISGDGTGTVLIDGSSNVIIPFVERDSIFTSFAEAQSKAANIKNGKIITVAVDETRSKQSTFYKYEKIGAADIFTFVSSAGSSKNSLKIFLSYIEAANYAFDAPAGPNDLVLVLSDETKDLKKSLYKIIIQNGSTVGELQFLRFFDSKKTINYETYADALADINSLSIFDTIIVNIDETRKFRKSIYILDVPTVGFDKASSEFDFTSNSFTTRSFVPSLTFVSFANDVLEFDTYNDLLSEINSGLSEYNKLIVRQDETRLFRKTIYKFNKKNEGLIGNFNLLTNTYLLADSENRLEFIEYGSETLTYLTFAEASSDIAFIPANCLVTIDTDETKNGRTTLYSISIDAVTKQKSLLFQKYSDPQKILPAPLTSTSFGRKGEFALDANFLYVGIDNNSWKRIALITF